MVRNSNKCNVCKAIQQFPKLEKDIDNSTFYIKSSSRTMLQIHKDYQEHFSYDSLRVHCREHQSLTPKQITTKNQKILAKKQKEASQIESAKATTIWDTVIKEGSRRLQNGEMEMRTSDLLKAVKDKSDYELKVKDQELQMAQMVAYFASGEGDIEESTKYDRRIIEGEAAEHFDPSAELAGDSDRRTEQSRAFYKRIAGDAPAPGTD